jgi:hypothetical protein
VYGLSNLRCSPNVKSATLLETESGEMLLAMLCVLEQN